MALDSVVESMQILVEIKVEAVVGIVVRKCGECGGEIVFGGVGSVVGGLFSGVWGVGGRECVEDNTGRVCGKDCVREHCGECGECSG